MRAKYLQTFIFSSAALLIASCHHNNNNNSAPQPEPAKKAHFARNFLVSIAIASADTTLKVGTTTQMTAKGSYNEIIGQRDLTDQVTWSSSDLRVASVNSKGIVTVLKAGTVKITATLADVTSNTVVLTVTDYSKFAYVLNSKANTVSTYALNTETGALTFIQTNPTGTNPTHLILDPSEKNVYVTNNDSATVSTFTRNANTGILTPVAEVATGTGPTYLVTDTQGACVYVLNQKASTVSMFNRDQTTGALTELSSPLPTVQGVTAENNLALRPSFEDFLYVPSSTTRSVTSFQREPNGGNPCQLSLAGVTQKVKENKSFFLAFTPIYSQGSSKFFAYLTSATSNAVSVYDLPHSEDAAMRFSSQVVEAAPSPTHLVFSSNGKYAYVLKSGNFNLSSVFSVDYASGALTLVNRLYNEGVDSSSSIAFDSSGKFAYITKPQRNAVAMYSVNANGTLDYLPVPEVATENSPSDIVLTK